MSDFIAMDGHGFYVWGSYIVSLGVIITLGVARHRRLAMLRMKDASAPDVSAKNKDTQTDRSGKSEE